MRTWMRWSTTVAAAALLAGCGGGSNGDGSNGDGAAGGGANGDGSNGAADTSRSCEATDVTATFPDGNEVTLDRSGALAAGDGAAYTVLAADFEPVNADGQVLAPPQDGQLAGLGIGANTLDGAEQPIEEGVTIEWTDEPGVLTFSVVFNAGRIPLGTSTGAEGTVEVAELDAESICVHVDYSDDEKSLVGSIVADIVQPAPAKNKKKR